MAAVGGSMESLLKVETGLLEPRLTPSGAITQPAVPSLPASVVSLPCKLLVTIQNPILSVTVGVAARVCCLLPLDCRLPPQG